jgi:hypothetical protein
VVQDMNLDDAITSEDEANFSYSSYQKEEDEDALFPDSSIEEEKPVPKKAQSSSSSFLSPASCLDVESLLENTAV